MIQHCTPEQVKSDQAKAKADAAAAESAAIAHKQSQFDQVAALEDAKQTEDDTQLLEYQRPDLRIDPKLALNTDVDTLSDSRILDKPINVLTDVPPLAECSSYHGSSHSEDFLTGWEEVEDHGAVMVEENYKDKDKGKDKDKDYTILSDSKMEASQASEDHS